MGKEQNSFCRGLANLLQDFCRRAHAALFYGSHVRGTTGILVRPNGARDKLPSDSPAGTVLFLARNQGVKQRILSPADEGYPPASVDKHRELAQSALYGFD